MKNLLALCGISAIVVVASEAAAWAPLDNTYPRWDTMPVQYYINQSTIPQSIAAIGVARLDKGFASWSAPSCTFFATKDMGNTNLLDNTNDGQNVLRWQSGTWPAQFGDVNSVIGVTLPVWDNNSVIFDADITFNNVGFCWNDNGSGNCVDTTSIATHEEGHFLGLDHSNVSGATMEPFYGGGNSLATLEQDDMDGVCALYPSMGTAVSSGSGSGGSDCNSCADTAAQNECKAQYNACGASQECIAYYQCVTQCGSQACADGCAQQYPNGASTYGALIDCACNVCTVECSAECGGSSGSSSSSSGGGNSSSSGAGGSSSDATGAWNSDDDEEPTQVNPTNSSSCSCSMTPSQRHFGAFLGFSALALGWARRRSRRSDNR